MAEAKKGGGSNGKGAKGKKRNGKDTDSKAQAKNAAHEEEKKNQPNLLHLKKLSKRVRIL